MVWGEILVFLIILIIAGAVLVGWLFFEVARLTIGDVRLPRMREHSLQGAAGGAPSIAPPNGGSAEAVSLAGEDSERAGGELPSEGKQFLYDDVDVEEAVRDRLYGQRGRHA